MNSNVRISSLPMYSARSKQESAFSLWIFAGISDFGRARLESPSITFTQSEHAQKLASCWQLSRYDWAAICSHTRIPHLALSEPLQQMLKDYQLNLTDLFLLGLCGEVENSYWLNIALAELQAPDHHPRPRAHLACEVLNDLFDVDITPIDFVNHPLVSAGILKIVGDDPWPLRHLQVDGLLWSLLSGAKVTWPGISRLVGDEPLVPEALQQPLAITAQHIRLGRAHTIVLRGARATAIHVARELANYLDIQPIKVTPELWQRDKFLHLAATYDKWLPIIEPLLGPGEIYQLPDTATMAQVVICGHEGIVQGRAPVELDIPGFTLRERQMLWQNALSSPGLAQELAESSLIDGASIQTLSHMAQAQAAREQQPLKRRHILDSRLHQGNHRLRQLAQPVLRQVDSDALVLPAGVAQQLNHLIQRCKKRETLWQDLGCTAQASVNLGIRVLFSGESGTGKTLAASYIATELGAPLYRVDLASVMNKYIGETEKNLGLLLDEAAASDTILLLDEADALFGKRTDTGGAGDRFANMLTNYLLTRIETHPGIAILTSNGRSRIDSAFTRRLDAIIEFIPPAAAERLLIWQSHLGARNPGDQFCQLLASYSELPGGFIRNAVLAAATQINSAENPTISSDVLLRALMDEYRKLGKAIPTKIEHLAQSLAAQ